VGVSCAAASTNQETRIARDLANQVAAVELIEAYRGQHEILVKYRGVLRNGVDERVFHASAPLPAGKVPHEATSLLSFLGSAEWHERSLGLEPIPVFDGAFWRKFQARLLLPLIPEGPGSGVVLSLDPHEFVFFRDSENELAVEPYDNAILRSGRTHIVRTYTAAELTASAIDALEELLHSDGGDSRCAIFWTGVHRNDSLPFLYIDLDTQIALLLKFRIAGPRRDSVWREALLTIDHIVVDSTLWAAVENPASTVHRLFWLVAHNIHDTARAIYYLPDAHQPLAPAGGGAGMDLEAWEKELNRSSGTRSVSGQIEFLIDGEEYFSRLEAAIEAAEHSIDIRTFIFDRDDYSVRVAKLLKDRSQAIAIRVLVDGIGTRGEGIVDPLSLPADVELPDSIIDYLKDESSVAVRVQNNPFFTADHVKTTIIDGRLAFTGGMNIGREYRFDWHDMMVQVRGPVVQTLEFEFEKQWTRTGLFGDVRLFVHQLTHRNPSEAKTQAGYPVRVLLTTPSNSAIYNAQLAAVRRAGSYIYIENPYFCDDTFLKELIKARRRGVDVRVVLPERGNHQLMARSNNVTANYLFQNGIRVYFYPKMTHVKAAVYDGWTCVGSANFDRLSFRDNLELNLATSNSTVARDVLEKLFYPDFKASREMTEPTPTSWLDELSEKAGDRF
jgi:cardiolipin synthase